MTIEVEKKGLVWTVIHNRPEARNAMDRRVPMRYPSFP
jgi:hypothetical protein